MIKVLPGHIANMIAAGEVVQRPSSVVKELMENALDAGASNIHVIIKDAGRTLIQVIDDGCGMSPDDAKTAFQRHATSKISEIEHLSNIQTLGFRGEALASICSVAEVTLRTKERDAETGYEVKYAESALQSESEAATPNGCNFMVRNLFYNIPARRKFLKKDTTEFRQISQEFSRIALTSPDISFRLTHNDNDIYYLNPAPLKKRIQDVAGKEIIKELVEISVDTSIVKISGYIGKPGDARKTPGNQYLFVNNRYFRSPWFHKAVLKGYQGLIPEGYLPSYFIFFETDPRKIDVNIHPSKTEVKFEEDFAIFDFLTSATRESLGKNSFMPSIDFDTEGAPEIPKANTGKYIPPPKINYDPLFNPFKEESFINPFEQENSLNNSNPMESGGRRSHIKDYPVFSEPGEPHTTVLQTGGRYIVTTIKSGLLIINIRRAKERILYERYLGKLNVGNALSQQSLFPQEALVSRTTMDIMRDNEGLLKKMGFDITLLEDSVMVNGLPEGFSDNAGTLPAMIDNLTQELSEGNQNLEEINKEKMAMYLASTGTSGKMEPLNNLEAATLVDSLFACKEPAYTPRGKKCFNIVDIEEIENKLF
jgi:DNA mismatch repair protein MutL